MVSTMVVITYSCVLVWCLLGNATHLAFTLEKQFVVSL